MVAEGLVGGAEAAVLGESGEVEVVGGDLEAGGDVLLVNDVQGALAVQELATYDDRLGRGLVSVYIVTGTVEELRARLESRGKDSPEVITERLQTAEMEMAQSERFDRWRVSGTMEEDWRWVQSIYEQARNG